VTMSTTPITLPVTMNAGVYPITANYSGDTTYAPSLGTMSLTIKAATTKTTLSASPTSSAASPLFYGTPVTYTASVAAVSPGSGVPTGSVTFKDGLTVLGTVPLDNTGTAT